MSKPPTFHALITQFSHARLWHIPILLLVFVLLLLREALKTALHR